MIDVAWAQANGAAGAAPTLVSFLPLGLVFVVFYLLLIRPQQQKAKEHRLILANLKKNDQIITSGGLHGRILALGDEVVTVEIAPNVKVQVSRAQIATVVTADKSAAEKEKAK